MSRFVEAGNLYVGDTVVLPGDMVAEVVAFGPFVELDRMSLVTAFGEFFCRTTDTVRVLSV